MKNKVTILIIIAMVLLAYVPNRVYGANPSPDSTDERQSETTKTDAKETEGNKEKSLIEKGLDFGVDVVSWLSYLNPELGAIRSVNDLRKSITPSIEGILKDNGIDITDNDLYNFVKTELDISEKAEELALDPYGTTARKIKENGGLSETLYNAGKWLIDFFFTGIGDFLQATINILQTYAISGTGSFPTVVYSESDIKSNNDINQYINLDESYYTTRTKYKSKDYYFNMEDDAKFPLIVVDCYSLSVGKVATTDINFLIVDKTIHKNSQGFWGIIRNLAVSLIRTTIYLSAAALITSLIYHGIVVVGNVYKSPQKRAEHQDGFNRFLKSVLMLCVSVLIMALIISASQMIIRSILSDTVSNEFPIQVTDKTSNKKFSTNFTGYYRYKCQSTDLAERAASAIIYFIFAICNFIIGIFMILRFLAIIVFSVYGVGLSVIYIIKKQDFDDKFLKWGFWYCVIAVIPVAIATFQKIALEISCGK